MTEVGIDGSIYRLRGEIRRGLTGRQHLGGDAGASARSSQVPSPSENRSAIAGSPANKVDVQSQDAICAHRDSVRDDGFHLQPAPSRALPIDATSSDRVPIQENVTSTLAGPHPELPGQSWSGSVYTAWSTCAFFGMEAATVLSRARICPVGSPRATLDGSMTSTTRAATTRPTQGSKVHRHFFLRRPSTNQPLPQARQEPLSRQPATITAPSGRGPRGAALEADGRQPRRRSPLPGEPPGLHVDVANQLREGSVRACHDPSHVALDGGASAWTSTSLLVGESNATPP